MPPLFQTPICHICYTPDITPGKRKCRNHRKINAVTRLRTRCTSSTTHPHLTFRDINPQPSSSPLSNIEKLPYFGSSILNHLCSSILPRPQTPKRQRLTTNLSQSSIEPSFEISQNSSFTFTPFISSSTGFQPSQTHTLRSMIPQRTLFPVFIPQSQSPFWSPQDIQYTSTSNNSATSNSTTADELLQRFRQPFTHNNAHISTSNSSTASDSTTADELLQRFRQHPTHNKANDDAYDNVNDDAYNDAYDDASDDASDDADGDAHNDAFNNSPEDNSDDEDLSFLEESSLPSIGDIIERIRQNNTLRTSSIPHSASPDNASSFQPSQSSHTAPIPRPQAGRPRRRLRLRSDTLPPNLQPIPDPIDPTHHSPLSIQPKAWISCYSVQVEPHTLGLMNKECPHCHALHWINEATKNGRGNAPQNLTFELCCKKGAIYYEPISEIPAYLKALFQHEHPHSRVFLKNIRQINASLAMVSVDMKPNERMHHTAGLRTFQLQGSIYHVIGPSHVQPGVQPAYGQLFFLGPDDASAIRHTRNPNISEPLLNLLSHEFDRHNSYCRIYKRGAAALANTAAAHPEDQISLTTKFQLQLEAGYDKNRQNLPSTYEVAAIIPDIVQQNWDPFRAEVVCITREPPLPGQSPFKRINRQHPGYHPMAYPLLFPLGGPIYEPGQILNQNSRRNRAPCAQPRHLMFFRRRTFNHLLAAGQLFCQFLVDVTACIIQDRLCYLEAHQKNFRTETYASINHNLAEAVNPDRIGKRTFLPSSFTGGPRFMANCYQDAMALVRRYGKPDLFITMTANPNWPEIKDNLLPQQTANDRPDLTVRVTHLKFKAFKEEIVKTGIFGQHQAHCYSVEYQKRGLPHFHFLLWLNHSAPSYPRQLTPEYVDNLVMAELPPPEIDPDGSLAKIVKSCMLHRECGADHPLAVCMRDGRCEKRFPKPLQESSTINTNGYPVYRRRQDTAYIQDGQRESSGMLNSRVVPYNPYLTRRYNCHINVELCANITAVRYIFKYIYKGPDLTTLRINAQHTRNPLNPPNIQDRHQTAPDPSDEINCYLSARYLGPCEAFWRLCEFKIHGQFPPVEALGVHLPEQNPVTWVEGMTSQDLQDKINDKHSTLMGYFKWNLEQKQAAERRGQVYNRDNQALYLNFPEHHVWDAKKCYWKLRQRGVSIGRIHQSTPQQGERWFLRRLLTTVRGATSFEDLRSVNGVQYPTFQAACLALGLIENDSEWTACFEEAKAWASGENLRSMFVTSLEYGPPVQPLDLWNRFREWICDDLPHRIDTLRARGLLTAIPPGDSELHFDLGLYELRKRLREINRDLLEFNLPLPQQQWEQHLGNPLIQRERNYNPNNEQSAIDRLRQQLNVDQAAAFAAITERIDVQPERSQFFIQGPAGTGKTFLYHCLCHYFRAQSKIVVCVASSGIAALLLPGGTTAHSRFRIPLESERNSFCTIPATGHIAALLLQTSLIIWDEAPMTHRFCYDAVDRTLRDICEKPDAPFGGIPVVFGGDFAQILPVIVGGDRAQTVDASLQRANIWEHCTVKRLTQNMRLQQGTDNQAFAEWIRTMSYYQESRGLIQLPDYIHRAPNEQSLIAEVYPTFPQAAEVQTEFYKDRAILAVTNVNVNDLNSTILQQLLQALPEPAARYYRAIDTLHTEEEGRGLEIPPEALNAMNPDGLPPFQLCLKPGIPVMLLRNINSASGLANGSRLILTRVHPTVIEGRLLGGDFHGQARIIPRIKLTTKDSHFPRFSRTQFPVKLCFAMTINKSQGQSLKTVGVDVRRPCFTHGQLYVALSRVTNVSHLHVLLKDARNDLTDNVVFPEALLEG